MVICIAGKNNIAVDICDYILKKYPKIPLLVVNNRTDDGIDRFQRSFLKFAQENDLSIVSLVDLYNIPNLLFFSLEFDRIIDPKKFISKSLFNIHFSLLPAYKGMYTSAIPILHGEKETGVTLHYIDSGIDTGDILYQERIEISSNETARSLYIKYIARGTKLVRNSLDSIICNDFTSQPQKNEGSTYFSKVAIKYSELKIDLNATAWQLSSQIRAFTFRDYQLPQVYGYDIVFMEITSNRSQSKSGTILEDSDNYIQIATIDYDVILYKDCFSEVLACCVTNNISQLLQIPHLEVYLSETDKEHGWSPLIVAAYNNSITVAEYLIKLGANVNASNFNGTTVIMYAKDAALRSLNDAIINLVLKSGADPYQSDYLNKNLFAYLKDQSMELYKKIGKWSNS